MTDLRWVPDTVLSSEGNMVQWTGAGPGGWCEFYFDGLAIEYPKHVAFFCVFVVVVVASVFFSLRDGFPGFPRRLCMKSVQTRWSWPFRPCEVWTVESQAFSLLHGDVCTLSATKLYFVPKNWLNSLPAVFLNKKIDPNKNNSMAIFSGLFGCLGRGYVLLDPFFFFLGRQKLNQTCLFWPAQMFLAR